MAVQHAEAPGGRDEQAGAGEQHADQMDRQLALRAGEAGGDHVTISGAARTPRSTRMEIASARIAKKVRAICAAASCSPRARSPACTGMNEPESAPSPKRFCSRLGIRNAALNASAASLTLTEVTREEDLTGRGPRGG